MIREEGKEAEERRARDVKYVFDELYYIWLGTRMKRVDLTHVSPNPGTID